MSLIKDFKLLQSWNRTKTHLRNAVSLIPISGLNENQTKHIQEFKIFLKENELELAFDELEIISETLDMDKGFWHEMLLAAQEMQLEEHLKRCQLKLKND